ncbi:unnamed protein product [Taenia asiatica]|uniref:Selenoprotein S n=1 Tax=Taenia asiatica TaxID=60517 RepID=A0A0R3WB25_TAEAS|nr:unnamed protein product [Taenia asiatica]
MDPDFEIEDVNGYGVPQPTASRDGGFFYRIFVTVIFVALYFLMSRFSAAFGARVARLATGAQERNYDEEMREARRRLQERFDNERKNRKVQNAEDPSVKATEKPKNTEKPQDASKRIKAPNPGLPNSSESLADEVRLPPVVITSLALYPLLFNDGFFHPPPPTATLTPWTVPLHL